MKTKLLHSLREQSKRKIGVFSSDDNTYRIVFDRDAICPDISQFNGEVDNEYQLLETGIKTLEEAKTLCDMYRRKWILQVIREMKYNNSKRYY